ncbi:hypothetical protein [Flavobacterium pallidum]|uniref:Uncharacterized protein n=1 Tax=Flavobacterium pallidum TaxID=2172098 RepID=A0A2S1SJM5_9FLAO|nr:hypothetical protein [Flavobacterium pallidum]AWI26623.1 hypothetical protein HYN49_12350 [Flavobacterium pallidum]
MKLFQIAIFSIYFLSTFILFGYYLSRKKKIGFGTPLIFNFLLIILLSDIYEIFAMTYSIPSAVHYKVYTFTEFYVLLWYFFQLNRCRIKGLYILSGILFFLLFIYVCIGFGWDFSESMLTDSYLSAFATIAIYIFSIHWFTGVFKDLPETSLLKLPDFYFVSGIIMYLFGPIFLFLLSSQLINADNEGFKDYWLINIVINIILRLFLMFGIWKIRK